MGKQKGVKSARRQEVRIIGGEWRRRKIVFAALPGLRPTPDRVRETLFNWLQADLPGVAVLDLFAGSGSLAFEALSRGAGLAVLVESAAPACRRLLQSKEVLNAEQAKIVQAEALSYLKCEPHFPFQVIFIDPPFQLNLYTEVFRALVDYCWVEPGSLIYVEAEAGSVPPWPDSWSVHRRLDAGNVVASLLRSL